MEGLEGLIMQKVLITGASGFIGRSITAMAAKQPEWDVHAVISGRREVRFPENVAVEKVNLLDLSESEKLVGRLRPDIILHLAWDLGGRDFLNSPENLAWTEVSLRLLRTFIQFGGKRFIFSGSSAEYGYNQNLCTESGPARPSDVYGVCKLAVTNMTSQFCSSQKIGFCILRFFSVYGAGESNRLHVIPSAIASFLEGRDFVCKGPNNVWDYVFRHSVIFN
jgi:UDP-glucose 4-epimerase